MNVIGLILMDVNNECDWLSASPIMALVRFKVTNSNMT